MQGSLEEGLTTKTGKNGTFSFTQLAPGKYILTVSLEYDFAPKTVTLTNQSVTNLVLTGQKE